MLAQNYYEVRESTGYKNVSFAVRFSAMFPLVSDDHRATRISLLPKHLVRLPVHLRAFV
jgi:hypothetical protein